MLFGEALAHNVALIVLIYDIAFQHISYLEVELSLIISIFADLGIRVELSAQVHNDKGFIDAHDGGVHDVAFFDLRGVLKGLFEHAKIFFFQFLHRGFAVGFTHLV